jgi:hypothetical protein
VPPRRRRGGDARTEVAEDALRHDHLRDRQRREDGDGAGDVREDVEQQDSRRRLAQGAGRDDEVGRTNLDRLRPDDSRGSEPSCEPQDHEDRDGRRTSQRSPDGHHQQEKWEREPHVDDAHENDVGSRPFVVAGHDPDRAPYQARERRRRDGDHEREARAVRKADQLIAEDAIRPEQEGASRPHGDSARGDAVNEVAGERVVRRNPRESDGERRKHSDDREPGEGGPVSYEPVEGDGASHDQLRRTGDSDRNPMTRRANSSGRSSSGDAPASKTSRRAEGRSRARRRA